MLNASDAALNFRALRGDQGLTPKQAAESEETRRHMETIRPDNADPLPLRASQHHIGTIMIRFVGLLFVAVAVLALLWSR